MKNSNFRILLVAAQALMVCCWFNFCLAWTTTTPFVVSGRQKTHHHHYQQNHHYRPMTTTSRTAIILHDASEGEHESELDFKRRMAMVRSLQMSYYKSTNFTHSSYEPSTGMVYDLPLWRVGWTELPGRSNMLHVHEPLYTNMFESLLYHEKPWYIGHLHLPKGSANLKKRSEQHLHDIGNSDSNNNNDNNSKDRAFRLKTWREEIDDHDKVYPRSAVVGTLMRIADYRRMEDGRLLLLVEALERFVVTNVKQELPYSIADVQLLPDTEEVDPDVWVSDSTEREIRDARALSVAEAFQRYHPYEYDETFRLPIPDNKDLQTQDIHGSMLTLLVPYVPLSKTADLSKLKDIPLDLESTSKNRDKKEDDNIASELLDPDQHSPPVKDEQPCLEQQLLQGKILKDYKHPDESVVHLSSEELEYRVWIEINNFLKSTKTPVSPVLLGLLPESIEWPSNFSLRKIADGIAGRTDLKHKMRQISPLLPSHRRLRRLSYSATTLLENKPGMEGLRQELLETASTKSRLAYILEKLESFNSIVWGEFE